MSPARRRYHAAFMRVWRKTHPLTGTARDKANARSYARCYKRRGVLTPAPCEMCGAREVQMHHDSYRRPLAVRWLCTTHHRALHARAA